MMLYMLLQSLYLETNLSSQTIYVYGGFSTMCPPLKDLVEPYFKAFDVEFFETLTRVNQRCNMCRMLNIELTQRKQ